MEVDKNGGKGSSEEGEIHKETPSKQSKVTKVSRTQQRRGVRLWTWSSNVVPMLLIGILLLCWTWAPLHTDSSIRNFNNEKSGYVANLVEQALLLPWDMAELWNLRKHKMFLSLKRDLALVHFLSPCSQFLFLFCSYIQHLTSTLFLTYECLRHPSSTCGQGVGWPSPLWEKREGIKALCRPEGLSPG